MGNFKILDHTADLKIEFSGENVNDLLNACAEGLSIYLYEKKAEKSSFIFKRTFEAEDNVGFLIEFLNELLFLMQQKKIIPKSILLKEEGKKYIVFFKGEKADYGPFGEIKAATFHEAKIFEEENILKAIITFDL